MSVRRPRLKYFLSFLVVRLADAGWRSLAGPAWLLPGPGASGLPRAVTAPSSSSTELLHSTVSYRSSPVTPTHSRLRLINSKSYRSGEAPWCLTGAVIDERVSGHLSPVFWERVCFVTCDLDVVEIVRVRGRRRERKSWKRWLLCLCCNCRGCLFCC